MHNAEFFGTFDITALVLTAFTLFFFGLVVYLRMEDRREGYPLEDDVTGRLESSGGLFFTPQPKTFRLPHGAGLVHKPNSELDRGEAISAGRRSNVPGTPLQPIGDPMLAGVGPGSAARRAEFVDPMHDGSPKIVPMRAAPGFVVERHDADPRGMPVLGADRRTGGVVRDVWLDRSEYIVRYLEIEVAAPAPTQGLTVVGEAAPGRRVLLPMAMAVVSRSRGAVLVDAILGSQFAAVPGIANPDQVTLNEEEKIVAYYGGGYLYAKPARTEPLL